MTDKELLNALGLHDRTISVIFDEDYQKLVERKVDDYLKKIEEEEKHKDITIDELKSSYELFQKKKEFMELFKVCFDEICFFMEKDPKRRVSVNCYTCIRGMDLRDQYGAPKKR